MDLFLDISKGIGVASAAGIVAAVLLRLVLEARSSIDGVRSETGVRRTLTVVAALAGAALMVAALGDRQGAAWLGVALGVAAAVLAIATADRILAGARGRLAAGRSSGTLLATALVVAAATAVLAVVLPPASYVVVAACIWVLLMRRRRRGEKYAGLRILR